MATARERMRIGLDAAAAATLAVALLFDVALFVVASLSVLSSPDGLDEQNATLWRFAWTIIAALTLGWYALFVVASYARWDAAHYNSYRMYTQSSFISTTIMTVLAWYDTTRPTLVVYVPMAMLRAPIAIDAAQKWWRTPLGTGGHAADMAALKDGSLYWRHAHHYGGPPAPAAAAAHL